MGSTRRFARTTARYTARAVTGALAAGIVLGVGELVSVAISPTASPFFAVGATTVDRAPAWAREFAISTFSTNDKPALFTGMTVLITLLGFAAGLLERRRRPLGSAMLIGGGALGVYAALNRPAADTSWAVPTIVAVVAGVGALRLMQRPLWPQTPREPVDTGAAAPGAVHQTQPGAHDPVLPRRRFFAVAASAAVLATAAWTGGRKLGEQVRNVMADRAHFRVPLVRDRAKAIAPGTILDVPGATPFITPDGDFYRVDTALQVPKLATTEWHLRIHGMVDRERTLDWDELISRAPIERVITLACVSNQVGGDLAGNATWVGYPIGELGDEP